MKNKLTNKQLEELHMEVSDYDYCFCSDDNDSEQYSIKAQYKQKDYEFWKDIKVFVFNVKGKNSHDKVIEIVKSRLGNQILIKSCTFH